MKLYTSFRRWLLEKYLKDNSPYGDFARDVKIDDDFPRKARDGYEIKWYLENKNCCAECLETFEDLWKEYKDIYYKGVW